MTRISAYDDDAKTIEEIAERFDISECEIIAALIQILDDVDIEDYL